MISFRPVTEAEFQWIVGNGSAEYAKDLAVNYRMAEEEAVRQSALSFAGGLGNGETVLAIALPDVAFIGYLWFSEKPETASAFINDFEILLPFRGRGHGTAALVALEALLKARAVTQIRLRVAA
jgi:ribosomal protein S18 acetylase RimI-like enzyme